MTKSPLKLSSLEEILTDLLIPHRLYYEKLGENYYAIFPETKRKKRKDSQGSTPKATSAESAQGSSGVQDEPSQTQVETKQAAFTISGQVKDENGQGLPGVNVLLKGTSTGTSTNPEGNYQLSIPDENSNGILVFSSIGYTPEEVPINGRSEINISLFPDIQSLSEVVVVGYGTQRKSDVTGAMATVTPRDFNTGVINNPLQAVQGRVAGLVITNPNGDPTQNRPAIRLRGISSLNANAEPLIVIDGVIGASLNTVAPEDIEQYDVLKDASAAAIYGARGANGVIIITTKRGKAGKTTLDYNTYVGFDSPSRLPDFLSPADFTARLQQRLDSTATSPYNTKWCKELTRTAVSHNHSIGISGGTDKFNYRASLAYLNQPGIAINSGLDRLNARFNATQKAIRDRLELQLNLSANTINKDFVSYQAFQAASRFSPLDPVYNPDGTYFQRQGAIEQENPLPGLCN